MVHKTSPRGIHFRRAGPRQKVYYIVELDFVKMEIHGLILMLMSLFQVYFESDEVHACIVTCGGLCPGLNTVIREIVCALYHMYGVKRVLGIEVSLHI